MNDFLCIEIEFPDVKFCKYIPKNRKIKIVNTYHAHLFHNKDEIQLKIYFSEETGFGEAFMRWLGKINWREFGLFLKVNVSKETDRIKKVDLSATKLIGAKNSSKYYENGKKYITVNIDSLKLYSDKTEEMVNTGEVFLEDKGFRIVQPFYNILMPENWFMNDGNFQINRLNNVREFFNLNNSTFRPEFNFIFKDTRKNRIASIAKEPKIQFNYEDNISEENMIHYTNVVLMLASFYHHLKINYITCRFYLPKYTITIIKLEQKNFIDKSGNFRGFGIDWNFNDFLNSNWQMETLKNYELISRAVKLFNQSHIVDKYSTFLIRYNIIEVCDNRKQKNKKFVPNLTKTQIKEKKDEALKILLETIKPEEHDEFKKRWHNIQSLLQNKPMKSTLVSFLEGQNLDPKLFSITLSELKQLRDDITHGSIQKVKIEKLRDANELLYKICGILILNLMGIKNWKFIK